MNDSQSSSKPTSKGKTSNWLLLKSKLNTSTKPGKKKAQVQKKENRRVAIQKSSNHTDHDEDEDEEDDEELEGDEEESHSVVISENDSVEEPASREQEKSSFLRGLEKRMRKQIVGLDCEMVGLGHNGKTNALARCSIVNFDGKVLYDQIIRPKGFVTDFRTKWSGIKKSDFRKEKENVVSFEECQESVAKLLKGKILVGHALQNDMAVLLLSHPRSKIRDTSRYQPYMRQRMTAGKFRPRSLKELTLEFLGKKIQSGEHDSVEDARCAVLLYRREMENWEKSLIEQRKGHKHSDENVDTTITPNEEDGDGNHSEDEKKIEENGSNENNNSNNEPYQTTMKMEELQPQKKRKLSIKYKQSSESTSNLISQLISETKKVDNVVHHSHENKKKKRKFAELALDEDNNNEEKEEKEAEKGVIVFEDERDKGKKGGKDVKKKNDNKKKNNKEANKKKRSS